MSSSIPPALDTSSSGTSLPPMEMFLRSTTETRRAVLSPDGKSLQVLQTAQEKLKKVAISPALDLLKLGQDGTLHLERSGGSAPVLIPLPSAAGNCDFSPSGKYFSVWSKPDTLVLFRTEDCARVIEHKTKTQAFDFPLHETVVSLLVGDEVRCWDLQSKEVCFKLKLPRLAAYSLCPHLGEICLATLQLGTKSGPATVSLYERERLICSYSSFRAEEAVFRWSPFAAGDVLAKIETMVDATGKSYYGESRLVRLSLTNKNALALDGNPVHDFQWSNRRHVFACLTGTKAFMMDGKTCEVLFEFATTHKNVCCFSPSGRFIVLAGFGNLAGKMEFYDTKKCKLLGSGRAEAAVSYAWSPCGRMFLTSTLAPRMNVDNGITVFSYRGEVLARWLAHGQAMLGSAGLVESRFMPVSPTAFPDLPASPKADGSIAAAPASEAKKPVMSFTQARLEAKKAQNAPPPPPPPAPVVVVAEPEPEVVEEEPDADPAKMIRKLKKLLRQIEEIEANEAKNEEQKLKIKKKREVVIRIARWETKLNATE